MIDLVAGARPNFVKLAPVARALAELGGSEIRIVHTGQHYDVEMSRAFFDDLAIPDPDVHLEVGSGSHGQQTARILERYEKLLLEEPPAACVVFGDVNSTVACALAAVKLGVPVAHVEAGLRSFDRSMPEEINRLLTDGIADLLLVTEKSGVQNLRREGVAASKIQLVGNVMIDTLEREIGRARGLGMPARWGVTGQPYGLVTLHRPANVDREETLGPILRLLGEMASELPLIFAMHPRTRKAIDRFGLEGVLAEPKGLQVTEPLPYHEFLGLMAEAKLVVTDSGGMQEETTVLGVPCITLRENTERPVTVELGTSRLVGSDPEKIRGAFQDVLGGSWARGKQVPLWDGKAAFRVAEALLSWVERAE